MNKNKSEPKHFGVFICDLMKKLNMMKTNTYVLRSKTLFILTCVYNVVCYKGTVLYRVMTDKTSKNQTTIFLSTS